MPSTWHEEHYADRTFQVRQVIRADGHGRSQFRINGKVVSAREWERQRQEASAAADLPSR